jgi:uncharacterized damage-inducible protein DinB
MDDTAIREHLARVLAWDDAHVGLEAAVADFPEALRGATPEGLPWSAWQLLEHLRLAQYDILDFCRNPNYREMKWPDDYWPKSATPPSAAAWDDAIDRYLADRRAAQALAADTSLDLGARIPHGSGQTYLRELLLIADHNAYHVGQLVLVRRLLGAWPAR